MTAVLAFSRAQRHEPYRLLNLETGERDQFNSLTRAYFHAEQIRRHGFELWQGPVLIDFFPGEPVEIELPEPARRAVA